MSMKHPYDVAILCGGSGTRLREVIDDRQKCVADVDGLPFLIHLIMHVSAQGFHRFVLCAGHKAETVSSAIKTLPPELTTVIVNEPTLRGTGGAIRNALPYILSDAFIALNGDSFCPVDLNAVAAFHEGKKAEATVVLSHADGRGDCGNVAISADCAITSFAEKESSSQWVNAGIYLFSKACASQFPMRTPLSLEKDVFHKFVGKGLFGYTTDQALLDIGTPDRYAKAAAFMRQSPPTDTRHPVMPPSKDL